MGLVWMVVRGYKFLSEEEASDMAHEGVFGLVKAIRTFDPAVSKFSTWAAKHIRWAILRVLPNRGVITLPPSQNIKSESQKEKAKKAQSVAPLDHKEFELCEAGESEPDENLSAALASLSPADRQLLTWKYTDGLLLREIGERLGGVKKERARQRLAGAIERLREEYGRLERWD